MNNNYNSKFDKFIGLLSEGSDDFDSSEESLKRFNSKMDSLLKKVKDKQKYSWVVKARKERQSFQNKIGDNIKELIGSLGSKETLIEAINQGKFGLKPQEALHVYFRNRSVDELDEKDLKLIFGDQKTLELLEEFKNGRTDES